MSEFNNLISMLNDKNDIILSQQAKIDELQGRIDDAIKALEQSKPNMMRQYDAIQALDILKGNKDD